MNQSKLDNFFSKTAFNVAQLSYARRKKVGAVLVKDNRIISIGYNGQPSHFDNECEIVHEDGSMTTKDTVIHAELNAIIWCAKNGIAVDGATLYLTLSPCVNCALLIIQSGIKHVKYFEEYRDTTGIDLLEKSGVKVEKIENA